MPSPMNKVLKTQACDYDDSDGAADTSIGCDPKPTNPSSIQLQTETAKQSLSRDKTVSLKTIDLQVMQSNSFNNLTGISQILEDKES